MLGSKVVCRLFSLLKGHSLGAAWFKSDPKSFARRRGNADTMVIRNAIEVRDKLRTFILQEELDRFSDVESSELWMTKNLINARIERDQV